MDWRDLNLFTAAEHQPFVWNGGQPAALLVHGFPGTPAELRPLATALHQDGWTAQGVLLPGFGPDIATLFEREWREWVETAVAAIQSLSQRHHPLLFIGYSMGSAVLLNALAQLDSLPDNARLVLLAPFWRLGTWRQRLIFTLLRPIFRSVQPLKKADFSEPQLREGIGNFMPDLDLDDPGVQQMLREFRIPARIVEQVLGVGKTARRAAAGVSLPTLVLQGREDELVQPQHTRHFLQVLPGPVQYQEVPGAHDLLQPAGESWSLVVQQVREYGRLLRQETSTL